MGEPRVLHDGDFFPLKKVGNNVFRFKHVEDVAQALGLPVWQGKKLTLQVVILAHNAETQVAQANRLLQREFAGHNWALLAVDNGSHDKTGELLQELPHVIFTSLKESPQPVARERALTLANAIKAPEAMTLLVELGKPAEAVPSIGSFCTVATHELWPEVAIMLKTLRHFHDEPAFVVCDEETVDNLKPLKLKNVKFLTGAGSLGLEKARETTAEFYGNKKRNNFHRPDAILKKMDAMEWAIEETGSTYFLDADIVVMDNLAETLTQPVWLSPHYHPKPANGMQYGFFNAGYLFTSSAEFPQIWRDLYLNRSKFYEQEGMTYLVERFGVGILDRSHNVGFWRRGFEALEEIKSFHVHLTFDLAGIADKGLRRVYETHRSNVLAYIKGQKPELFGLVEEFIK